MLDVRCRTPPPLVGCFVLLLPLARLAGHSPADAGWLGSLRVIFFERLSTPGIDGDGRQAVRRFFDLWTNCPSVWLAARPPHRCQSVKLQGPSERPITLLHYSFQPPAPLLLNLHHRQGRQTPLLPKPQKPSCVI